LTEKLKSLESPEHSLGKRIFYLLLILSITFAVYTPARNAQFTNWDDNKYITNNIDITSFKKYQSNLLTKAYEGNYHPFTMLSLAFDYSAGKLDPKVYHRTNIILHLVNAALVFWLIILLTGNLQMGFICGLLFGVHPIHVESVAWVSERKDVLYTLFFLSSLIAYVKYLKENKLKFYFLALLLFICSLLSKGMAVSLAITLLAIDYLFDRKIFNKKVLLEKIPFIALAILFGLITIWLQPVGMDKVDPYRASALKNPLYEKILYAASNIGLYISKLLIPFKLAVFYPYPEKENGILPVQYYLIPLLVIVFLATAFILLNKRKNYYSKFILFCFLFFLINIALVLQLIPVGDAVMADRYTYISSIGIFLLPGLAFKYIVENKPKIKHAFAAALTGYCLWLSYQAHQRCEVWHDSITLWTDEIEKYPNLSWVYNQRGVAKDEIGDPEGALADYVKCIQLDPYNYKAYINKGVLESNRHNYQTALRDFDKSISLKSNYIDTYKNRAQTKYLSGDYKGAIGDFSHYIKFKPSDHEAFLSKGLAECFLKNYPEALNDYNKAIELAPDDMKAYSNRGIVKCILKNYSGALMDFNKAIEIDPSYSEAYCNRAKVNFIRGLQKEACADLQKAAEYGYIRAKKELDQYCK
jgi:tetratricopeptide (TPR) repeat protein